MPNFQDPGGLPDVQEQQMWQCALFVDLINLGLCLAVGGILYACVRACVLVRMCAHGCVCNSQVNLCYSLELGK